MLGAEEKMTVKISKKLLVGLIPVVKGCALKLLMDTTLMETSMKFQMVKMVGS